MILLDPSPLQTMPPERQYEVLCIELEAHDPELAERPRVVAVTKADLAIPEMISPALHRIVPDVTAISAVTGEGVDRLLHRIAGCRRPSREGR